MPDPRQSLPPLPPLPSSLASMLGGDGLGGDGLGPASSGALAGQPGGPTPREIDAARGLATALLECLIAAEEGRALRSVELGIHGLGAHGIAPPGFGGIGGGPAAPAPLLLTGAQAARSLGVTPRTLRRLSAPSGPIPVVRLGRLIRYAPSDLERAVRSLRTGREPQP